MVRLDNIQNADLKVQVINHMPVGSRSMDSGTSRHITKLPLSPTLPKAVQRLATHVNEVYDAETPCNCIESGISTSTVSAVDGSMHGPRFLSQQDWGHHTFENKKESVMFIAR